MMNRKKTTTNIKADIWKQSNGQNRMAFVIKITIYLNRKTFARPYWNKWWSMSFLCIVCFGIRALRIDIKVSNHSKKYWFSNTYHHINWKHRIPTCPQICNIFRQKPIALKNVGDPHPHNFLYDLICPSPAFLNGTDQGQYTANRYVVNNSASLLLPNQVLTAYMYVVISADSPLYPICLSLFRGM